MNLLARHVILRALLRWTAAVAFCIPLKHRPHARLRALGMLLPLLGLTYVLDPAAQEHQPPRAAILSADTLMSRFRSAGHDDLRPDVET